MTAHRIYVHWGTGLAFLSHLWGAKFSFLKHSCPNWWEKDGSSGNPAVLGLWYNAGAIRLPATTSFWQSPQGASILHLDHKVKGCCRFSRRLGSFQFALKAESHKEQPVLLFSSPPCSRRELSQATVWKAQHTDPALPNRVDWQIILITNYVPSWADSPPGRHL